jgi:hypothetical protein
MTRRCRLALAALLALAPPSAAMAQEPVRPGAIRGFIEVIPSEGRAPVELAAAQVVRVGRVEGFTVIDTAAWVQQRSVEPVEAIARRLTAAGVRLIPLTDLNGARIYLVVDRVVLVRGSEDRHAAGARTAIVMVGLRFNTDVAVREGPEEVKAALRRALSLEAPDPSLEQPAATPAPPPR